MLEAIPWQTILIALGAAFLRSFFGWLENAMQDKHISNFEKAELGATMVRVLVMTLAIYFPMQSFGINAAELASAGSALVLDFILRKIEKQKKIVIEEEAEKEAE